MQFWHQLSSRFVPQVYAACNTGAANLNLADCLQLNDSGETVSDVFAKPTDLINIIVNNLFVFAGVIFFLMIIFAGFRFIGDAKGKEDAQKIVQTALIGFIIMFSAYWVVQIIKFVTGANILF